MIVRRQMEEELLDAAQQYPVVTLTGPRQSGKTVLVKKVFPDKPYCSLENPDTLALAETDPHSFLEQYPQPIQSGQRHRRVDGDHPLMDFLAASIFHRLFASAL